MVTTKILQSPLRLLLLTRFIRGQTTKANENIFDEMLIIGNGRKLAQLMEKTCIGGKCRCNQQNDPVLLLDKKKQVQWQIKLVVCMYTLCRYCLDFHYARLIIKRTRTVSFRRTKNKRQQIMAAATFTSSSIATKTTTRRCHVIAVILEAT